MSKAILVMDMPSCCIECACRSKNILDKDVCNCLYENNELRLFDLMHDRPDWCPLKEAPEKNKELKVEEHLFGKLGLAFTNGWNACLNKILGDE